MKSFSLVSRALAFACAASIVAACSGNTTSVPAPNYGKINHIVVIYQENWSFDGLYAQFPGANGVPPNTSINQVDKSGNPLTVLPQPMNNGAPDPRFPSSLPVKTYDAAQYVPSSGVTGDLIHRFYHEQLQIDGGKNDMFVAWSDNGGLVPSQYNGASLPEGQLAMQYTMEDNFFHSAFGGSFLNHQFLICACAPKYNGTPPASMVSNPDPNNLKDAQVTPDGYAINTIFSTYMPHPAGTTNILPPLTNPTIGDRLDQAGIMWKWYSGGWNNAMNGSADANFQFHHQPFAYYQQYADGTAAKAAHLQDEQNYFTDITNGNLPPVSFIKPLGDYNEHPGYAALAAGQQHVVNLVNAIQNSKYANDTLIIITYDENGGRWDHVAPPVIDKWGPGVRVPAILVGPMVKKNFVDHTQYETASILALIERRYGLQPLGTRDAAASPFLNSLTL